MLPWLLLAFSAFAEDTAAVPVSDDPYAWLEDVTSEKSLAWVSERNKESTGKIQDGAYKKLHATFKAVLDSDARIPYVSKMGGYYYNFWQDKDHERGVWRRTTLEEYRKPKPAWETVIDLDALDKAEGVSWVWHGANCLEPEYAHCLIALSRGGSDADVKREYDLGKKAWVADGFSVPEAKSEVGWITADKLWVATDMGEGSLTTSGYPREARVWDRGTKLADAPVVFSVPTTDVSVSAWTSHEPGYTRHFTARSPTFFTGRTYVSQGGLFTHIAVPDDAQPSVFREWLFVELRTEWTTGGKTWPGGSLLVTKFDDFMAGKREFEALFTPSATTALNGIALTPTHVVLNTLDNVKSRVFLADHASGAWKIAPMTGLPEFGTIGVSAVDSDESEELFITTTDFVTPTQLLLGSATGTAPTLLKALPAMYNAKGLEITQHEAVSKDGTKIPYFQVAKKGVALNGKNPTLLYGYGGFEVSMLPNYNGIIGNGWLAKGGVYVLANIRGGGEFGPAWHTSVVKENRQRVYEDFSAVAKDLVARKLTSAEHLGTMGGSNGGLLMGNMMTQYPELFGAIVCQVPLLDMKRYSHLLAGASWMDEYGDPDDPKQWEYIQTFSPYQLDRADRPSPPVLFTTSTRDDRVHPGHARKMAAKMLSEGKPVLLWEDMEGGHGGASTSDQKATMWGLTYSFLWKELK
ncbi:prolyl oligopeptidase [Deltaproteobacteria bacterium]|nr:prolyl oligopeptidase [Deltaproteobacteria bacterium]